MPDKILSLDLGTTSVRAMIVDSKCMPLAVASARNNLEYPAPGLVEQSANDLWSNVERVIQQVLDQTALAPSDIRSIGITAQRSSLVVWDQKTCEALHPIVSWQDLRGIDATPPLVEKGFIVTHQMAATKLEGVIDAIENGRNRAAAGELAFGNVDTFIMAKLSAGRVHAMDLSHLSAMGYFDYVGGINEALADAQNLPLSLFPEVVETAQELGKTDRNIFGAEVTIGAVVADQQSAMIAQGCTKPGLSKVTYGTSGTLNVNTGQEMKLASGAYPLVLKNHRGQVDFMIEGMVITAGATFDWLAHGLELIDSAAASEEIAAQVPDSAEVFVLPALQGLGSPYGIPEQHAIIGGLTRGSRKAHVVRAAIEGVAARVREALDCITSELPDLGSAETLRVDGGATRNDLLMQVQADLLGMPVERHAVSEATALGAAIFAGDSAGLWSVDDADQMRRVDRTFEPAWSEDQRESFFANWQKATSDVRIKTD